MSKLEQLKYIIEDSTIAQLLGVQNFTNDEAAILELVKNSYDAIATKVILEFDENQLVITDNGSGMNADDIKQHWMHIGKSIKDYEILDKNRKKRILAGSKGVGRFALSRLGERIELYSKKDNFSCVLWTTDWNSSTLSVCEALTENGTKIIIDGLREKWSNKRIENLVDFLSKTYNDDSMVIDVIYSGITLSVERHIPTPILGRNCLSSIKLEYDSMHCILKTLVKSDEFLDDAQKYCPNLEIKSSCMKTNIIEEFKSNKEFDLSIEELNVILQGIGNFSAEMLFNINSTSIEMERFLYKYSKMPESLNGGIVLYRNAFSISSFEGKRDWLGLGKRSRKSPAAASHPTGAWRVRENQLVGKIEIDKNENSVLMDLANRQGLDENISYQLFVEIVLTGIKEFERYRQAIIRSIDVKNAVEKPVKPTPISDKVVTNPTSVVQLNSTEARQLVNEIKLYRKENYENRRDKANVEERYKYDVRILNVLATTGLKASSIAHEMKNDRNSIADNCDNIIQALKDYSIWEELNSPEKTSKAYKNVPHLIELNKSVSSKILSFMDAMLSELEKKQFDPKLLIVSDLLAKIKNSWEMDYAWISIISECDKEYKFFVAEDILRVVFDNLILNSIQQNESKDHLDIKITIKELNDLIHVVYSDDGKGLDKKYDSNPRRILEVHETTRKNGHGLGMWIVNNTTVMSGGEIIKIDGHNGFQIEFTIGGKQ